MINNIVSLEFNPELEKNTKITYQDGTVVERTLEEYVANKIKDGIVKQS
jgi:hypothetical protein